MSCESFRAELVAFLQEELSASRRAEVQSHLATCRDCSAELDGFRMTQQAVGGLRVRAVSSGFEKKVQERIAAKVADLRSRGSVRFRTGRERNEEAAKWPGLRVWLARRRRTVWFLLIAIGPVVAAFALAWVYIVTPYFEEARKRREFRAKELEDLKRGLNYQLRRRAAEQRRDSAVSEDGWIADAGFPNGTALRLVAVCEPARGSVPEGRCVYVFTPAQWKAFLGQEAVRRGTPLYGAWKGMIEASVEVQPERGRLFLPPACFRQALGEPVKVSVLAIGTDHFEIWDSGDLGFYLNPKPPARTAPPPAESPAKAD